MSSISIGSAAWLRQERSSINRLYGQDVEDFTFSARQEMDWLNEHMEGVFTASVGGMDIAELLKTPARSAKKAVLGGSIRKPGSAKKRMGGALKGKVTTNVEDVFNSMPPPPLPVKVSPPLISQPATEEEEAPVQPTAEPENIHVDIENQAMQEDPQVSLSVVAPQRTHAHPSRRVSKADTFRDSGNWSQSSGVPSQQHQRIMARPRSPRKASDRESVVLEGEDEADVSVDMGRKSIASATYHTANEEEEEETEITAEVDVEQNQDEPEPEPEQEVSMVSFGQSSPFQEYVEGMLQGRDSRGRSSAHSANVASSPLRVLPVIEKRRSGMGTSDATVKNVEEAEELQAQQAEEEGFRVQQDEVEVEEMDTHPPSSPPAPVETIGVTKKRASNRQQTPSPVKEVEQLPSSPVPVEPEHQDEERPLSTSSGSPAPTDEDSPVPIFLRKSSLSFASLPPRGRISTTTTETVKLGGAGRSSWLEGRRALGRSLGGRPTMPGENPVIEDSEENASATERPRERKRSRGGEEHDTPVEAKKAQEEGPVVSRGSRRSSRKKSRSASYKGSDEELAVLPTQKEEGTTQEDEMDTEDDAGGKVAEHNKSASQRLQERIQQLGKLNSSARTTTSLSSAQETQSQPVAAAEPMYPDLPQVKETSKSRISAPQEQPQQQQKQRNSRDDREPSVEEDDWIPPARSASVRTTVASNKSSANLGRSKTVPAQSTPGTKNQALRGSLTKKPSEQSFEDALQKKSSRGELTPSGRPNLPQSLAFNAINSPHNIASPARTVGARFEDKVSIPLSPKPANKKSFVATSSSLQKSTTTEESPVTAAKNQTADAFKRAKEMFIKTNVLGSPTSTESLKSVSRLGHKPSFGSIGRSSSPRTPQGQISKQGTPNREMYPDLGNKVEEEVEMGVKSKRQTRGSKNKDMLQKQQEEEERLAREAHEAQRVREEEVLKAAAEENARQTRLEETRRLAEQRRKEKELQKQLAAQKKAAEEARIQREKEEREGDMRRHREELQRKEEELKRLVEEKEARLRQKQEEMRRQEMERRKMEEEEERVRKEAEDRRIAEQEAEEEEARKHAELEELRKKQDEDLRRKQDAEERRKRGITPIQLESDEEVEAPAAPVGNASASRIARPKSAMGGRPPSRLQPPSGGKRPLRQPPQKAERGKPTPVSIQVGTASQRAAMDRQKPAAPPSSTLLSAMKDTFAPKERPATAEPTLAQSNSAPNLKKSTSTQSIAASSSTSNLKKASTIDEKKREENRRLIEARREEIRRKEAAAAAAEEEKRKVQGRRAVERDVEPPKKTMPKGKVPATKITRVPANANLRKLAAASVEDVTITPQQEREPPDTEPSTKKGPKRAFNAEDETPQTTTAAPTATGSTYGNRLAPPKMPDAKKRKTEEWELDNLPPPPAAPAKAPVRPSAAGAKRDWPAKSTYVQGYSNAPTAISVAVPLAGGSGGSSGSGGGGSGASTIKVATKAAASSSTITTEGVKFSNEKIRFAADPTTTTPGPSHGPSKTPKEKPILKKSVFKTPNDPQKRVFSPMKGDGIELPEIPTDSEDEYSTSPSDSDSDSFEGPTKSSRFPVPHWAASPELKQALVAQQTMDPEEVFGPIGPLQMEEIFRGSGAQGKARFRNRSSSANWSTGDKLTREEVERDREARVRMIQRGGWDMGVMPEGFDEGSSTK